MNQIDTPRTNAAIKASGVQWGFALLDCSSELERELTAVTEQRDSLHELHNKNAATSKELLELCGMLRKELIAVTKQRDEYGNLWADLSRACVKDLTKVELELADATDELMETRKDYNCLAELLNGHDATECRDNLVRLKEQCDMLANDLRKFVGDALFCSHADTATDVSAHRQIDDSGDALTMP